MGVKVEAGEQAGDVGVGGLAGVQGFDEGQGALGLALGRVERGELDGE